MMLNKEELKTAYSLFYYLKSYKYYLFLIFLIIFLEKIVLVSMPMAIRYIIDQLHLIGSNEMVLNNVDLPLALSGVLIYGGMKYIDSILVQIRGYSGGKLIETITYNIGMISFNKINSVNVNFYQNKKVGAITRDLDKGSVGISDFISASIYGIFPSLIEVFFVCGIFLVFYGPLIFSILAISVSIYIALSIYLTEKKTPHFFDINESNRNINAKLTDTILNFENVRLFNAEKHESNIYKNHYLRWKKALQKNRGFTFFSEIILSLIVTIAIISILYISVSAAIDKKMTIGDVVLINVLMFRIFTPLSSMGMLYRQLKRSLVQMQRMFKIINLENQDHSKYRVIDKKFDDIVFKNVSFSYEKERKILKNVSRIDLIKFK